MLLRIYMQSNTARMPFSTLSSLHSKPTKSKVLGKQQADKVHDGIFSKLRGESLESIRQRQLAQQQPPQEISQESQTNIKQEFPNFPSYKNVASEFQKDWKQHTKNPKAQYAWENTDMSHWDGAKKSPEDTSIAPNEEPLVTHEDLQQRKNKFILEEERSQQQSFRAHRRKLERQGLAKTLILNKPPGYECSHRASSNKNRIVYDLLPQEMIQTFHIAGRLDSDSSGLVILSEDGDLINTIIESKQIEKRYRVTIKTLVASKDTAENLNVDFYEQRKTELSLFSEEDEHALRNGTIQLNQEPVPCLPVTHFEVSPATTQLFVQQNEKGEVEKILASVDLELGIVEGKYHQVKRMMAALGKRVIALHRISIGNCRLDEVLQQGQTWRYLEKEEIEQYFQPKYEEKKVDVRPRRTFRSMGSNWKDKSPSKWEPSQRTNTRVERRQRVPSSAPTPRPSKVYRVA